MPYIEQVHPPGIFEKLKKNNGSYGVKSGAPEKGGGETGDGTYLDNLPDGRWERGKM